MRSRTGLHNGKVCSKATVVFGVSVLLFLGGTAASPQDPAAAPPARGAMADTTDQNKQLTDQIAELRAQVAKLEAAVQQTGTGKRTNPKSGMKMSPAPNKDMGMMDDDKSEMGMPAKGEMGGMSPAGNGSMSPGMSMGDDKDEMSGMPMGGNTNATPGPDPSMGMCCMGRMASGAKGGMSGMQPAAGRMALVSAPSSAIPGHAGVSHLYHIGSNGFFLNHSQHITLTPNQKLSLTNLKKKAMLERDSAERNIEEGEEEVYTLTSADQPDHDKIQAEVLEIEKLRAAQRMDFIRAVANASSVLTPEQRKALLGTMVAARR